MAMVYRSFSPADLLAEMNRMQRALTQPYDSGGSIRGFSPAYPALNVGGTPQTVEIFAFAPGLDPSSIDVQLEKNVLSIAGERKHEAMPDKATRHIDERFAGPFRRAVTLPDDIDASGVVARYQDGVLHIQVPRHAEALPRRITVQ